MAFQSLTLGAAITASQLTFPMTNVSGAVVLPAVGAAPLAYGVPILIDSEFMYVVSQPATGLYTVRCRGSEGTAAVPHDTIANVYASNAGDFGNPLPASTIAIDPSEDQVISIGQDGTLTVPGGNAVLNINKPSAAALILPAPPAGDNGLTVVFTSNTAFAHVITVSPAASFQDGTSSSPKTTITFAAFKGASVELTAENGFWNVMSQQNVTLT